MRNFQWVQLPELQFDLQAQTGPSGRLYSTPDGKKYPSITTVLSGYDKAGLLEWRKRVGTEEAERVSRIASNRGSKLHSLYENYLMNSPNMSQLQMRAMPDVKTMFAKMRPIIDARMGRVYSIEQPLYSHRLKIAGRVDCIAEWDGILSVIDWKTALRPKQEEYIKSYFMQGTAYCEMYECVTKMPIEQVVIAIAVDYDEPQIFVKNKRDYLVDLEMQIDEYYRDAGQQLLN
jgi:genome maintenance exonuclease 1